MMWIEQGSPNADVWIVGEAPGQDEVRTGRPFTGASGTLLDSCLREAGISRADCYLTNVCHERPPSYTNKKGKVIENDIEQFFLGTRDGRASGAVAINGRYPASPVRDGLARLTAQIGSYRPRVVILLGNTPLWGLAGKDGITKWRGSTFRLTAAEADGSGATCGVAAFHPADCLPNRSPQHRPLLVHDLERARRVLHKPELADDPQWDFFIPKSIADVREWFVATAADGAKPSLPSGPLAADIETRGGQITCIGFASSKTRAICIPFARSSPVEHGYSYWSAAEELTVLQLLHDVMTTRSLIFHHGIYDCQYIAKQWGFMPRHDEDTMVMQHVAFPGFLGGKIDPVTGKVDKRGSSLSLSFVASLFCERYRFWKDDGRQWNPDIHDEQQYWYYNCEDVARTWECHAGLEAYLERHSLIAQYRFIMRTLKPIYKMMFRGFLVQRECLSPTICDDPRRQLKFCLCMKGMHSQCGDGMDRTRRWIAGATGIADINPDSNPQMVDLFYKQLDQKPIWKGKGGDRTLTCDDDALTKIARRTPLLAPLCEKIQQYRSFQTVRKDCDIRMLSRDGRLRTTLNPAFVETFRLSSNETAFGEGTNMQNMKRPD